MRGRGGGPIPCVSDAELLLPRLLNFFCCPCCCSPVLQVLEDMEGSLQIPDRWGPL